MQFLGFGDGSDGDLVIASPTTEAPIDSQCSGSAGGATLTVDASLGFVANQIVFIHQTRGTNHGNWEKAQVLSYVGTTLTLRSNLVNTYDTSGANNRAQVRVVKQYRSITVNATWSAKQWDGNKGGILAVMCSGQVKGANNISASNAGFAGGIAGGSNNGIYGYSGEGTAGPSVAQSHASNGNGGGGSKDNDPNAGGGGNANQGEGPGTGQGGIAVGSADLTTMDLGGGGGGMSRDSQSSDGTNGAGIIAIWCDSWALTGSSTLNSSTSSIASFGGSVSASGGTGAGGCFLLKARSATMGVNLVDATAAASGASGFAGGRGSVGRVHLDVCSIVDSATYSTNPPANVTVGGLQWCSVPGAIM